MQVIGHPAPMRAWADQQREAGQRIVLVPTMGALHAGHVSLVTEARQRGDAVVVSIFINPTQFGPNEDLDRYPRDLNGDVDKLRSAGADVVFTPNRDDIYPDDFNSYVVPTHMAEGLCGAGRPGHFRGVCTIVTILFRITRCHAAVFGQKDFQQLQIIRRMVKDLWLDVDVVGAPIVREADGLALSSRNVYLSPADRERALALSRSLAVAERLVAAGEQHLGAIREAVRAVLAESGIEAEYIETVDVASLRRTDVLAPDTLLAIAARVGETRLIDNRVLRA